MTAGGSSMPEVQRLLRVLSVGRRVGEAGTAFGEGAAAMAETASSVVTVERDAERAAIAAERLRPFSNVELVVGTWQDVLPERGPFGLLFHDAGDFKRSPDEYGDLVLRMLEPGGLLVMDDMTPGRQERDPIREWVRGQPGLLATEVLTTPQASALVIARL